MLSCQQKLVKALLKLRIVRKLSQHEVAALAGFCQPYLAQVEGGVRPVSARALAKLEQIYGKKLSRSLWKGVGRRGRPGFRQSTRRALREFGVGVRRVWDEAAVVAPRHPQAHQVRRSSDPLWPMALHLSSAAREEVLLLEKLRGEDEAFWRQFNSLRFDSWSEKRLLVRVGLLGGQLMGIRLERLGCSLKLVDGRTGKNAGLHRAFVMKGDKASLIWCQQVAVEVEGRRYHADQKRERRRDRALGIPMLHLDAGELDKPGLITRILRWAYSHLPVAV